MVKHGKTIKTYGFPKVPMDPLIQLIHDPPDRGVLEKPPDWALLVFLGTKRCDLVRILVNNMRIYHNFVETNDGVNIS